MAAVTGKRFETMIVADDASDRLPTMCFAVQRNPERHVGFCARRYPITDRDHPGGRLGGLSVACDRAGIEPTVKPREPALHAPRLDRESSGAAPRRILLTAAHGSSAHHARTLGWARAGRLTAGGSYAYGAGWIAAEFEIEPGLHDATLGKLVVNARAGVHHQLSSHARWEPVSSATAHPN